MFPSLNSFIVFATYLIFTELVFTSAYDVTLRVRKRIKHKQFVMSSSSKKQKIAEEKRTFQDKWETLYFVTEVKDRAQCLICSQVIAVLKEYNVRRHYDTASRTV